MPVKQQQQRVSHCLYRRLLLLLLVFSYLPRRAAELQCLMRRLDSCTRTDFDARIERQHDCQNESAVPRCHSPLNVSEQLPGPLAAVEHVEERYQVVGLHDRLSVLVIVCWRNLVEIADIEGAAALRECESSDYRHGERIRHTYSPWH